MARTSRTGTRTDLALLGVALSVALVSLILPGALRARVQGSLRSSVAAPLVSAQAWAERGRQAIGDHGRLVASLDSVSLIAQSAAPLKAENERLRGLMGLAQRLQWGFVATEVLHPPRGGDEHTVLLPVGSAAGVRPFSPLTVPEGLIGMVTTVDASSSTAILWTHPDFRASATTTDGAAFGIVAAHLGAGPDRFLLELRGVPFRNELKAGTLIVSSGLGNVFPRGIPIGLVLRETKTIEGWARTYLLRPIVSPDAASAAMVLLPSRAAAGVTGAWSSAAAAEGTQRVIAAAGDSVLADSVRRIEEQLKQLATLDSLRRAAIYRGDSGVRLESDSSQTLPRPPVTGLGAPAATAPQPTPLPAASRVPATPGALPATQTVPARPAVTVPIPAPTGAAPIFPPKSAIRADSAGVRSDSVARARARARARRAADSTRARAVTDSVNARNRAQPVVRPPESPFRLPPAGVRE
jgi:rod shape-determining protein MreC